MNDSSTASRQIQIEAIRQSISKGDLTAQRIHDVMLAEITTELSKSHEEVDIDYVNACQEFLMELNRSRSAAVPSHYEKNLTDVRRRFQSRFSLGPRTLLGRFAVVMCLVVLITTAGLLVPEGWIITRQSEDEGQYIMQGIKTPEGFVSVANAGPAMSNLGTYNTSDWSEVIHLLGGIPAVPQWVPTGWSVHQYTVALTETSSSLTIAYVHNHSGDFMSYTYYHHFDYDLYMIIEQDEEGVIEILDDGSKVYITQNINRFTARWNNDHTEFLLSCNLSKDHLLRIVKSVE